MEAVAPLGTAGGHSSAEGAGQRNISAAGKLHRFINRPTREQSKEEESIMPQSP